MTAEDLGALRDRFETLEGRVDLIERDQGSIKEAIQVMQSILKQLVIPPVTPAFEEVRKWVV